MLCIIKNLYCSNGIDNMKNRIFFLIKEEYLIESNFQIRRGGGVADRAGLLNRCRALTPYREFESHPLRDLMTLFSLKNFQ